MPIEDGTIRATELRKIKVDDDDFGLMTYDPAFMNTASCRSAITYIDGDRGILEYRGYPIEQLAEKSTLPRGRLPADPRRSCRRRPSSTTWTYQITNHTFVHENIKEFMQGFRYDAHPMGMLLASVGALSTFYPEANEIKDAELRYMQVIRLIAKMPTLAAFSYRHNRGLPVRLSGQRPLLRGQLPLDDLQDDRAQVRAGSAARARARRPLHPPRRPRAELLDERGAERRLLPGRSVLGGRRRRRGALRAAARRRQRGGAADAAPDRQRGQHPRVHRGRQGGQGAADGLRPPRLQELRPARADHQEGVRGRVRGDGQEPAARTSPPSSRRSRWRTSTSSQRKLYPNVDFYSGLIYEALGMPVEMFPVLFAIGRTSGWIAQWLEMIDDSEQKIARPRQIYTGRRAASTDASPVARAGWTAGTGRRCASRAVSLRA